jgi:hypothetical protein
MAAPPDPDTTWNILPNELKQKVLSYLSPEDLASLNQVNHEMNHQVTAFHDHAAQEQAAWITQWANFLTPIIDQYEQLLGQATEDPGTQAPLTTQGEQYKQMIEQFMDAGGTAHLGDPTINALIVRFQQLIAQARERHFPTDTYEVMGITYDM